MDRYEIIREVQNLCADIHEHRDGNWNASDGARIAALLNGDSDPWGLFRFMDERTGDFTVGYRTKDDREWFYVLRQMRNTPGSGLFENLRRRGDS